MTEYKPEAELFKPTHRGLKAVPVLALCAICSIAAYVASPWVSLAILRDAVKSGDSHTLSKHVDFPAVRTSLKEQMKLQFMKSMAQDRGMRENPFAGLAAALGPAMIDNVIDASVTADGIAYLIQEGKLQAAKKPGGADARSADPAANVLRQGFAGFDDFEIEFVSGAKVWLRRGSFLSWQVYKVAVPLE